MDETRVHSTLPKSRSRWRRFGLRTLLIFVFFFQLPLIWYYYKRQISQSTLPVIVTLRVKSEGRFAPWTFESDSSKYPNAFTPQPTWIEKQAEACGLTSYSTPPKKVVLDDIYLDAKSAECLAQLSNVQSLELHRYHCDSSSALPGAELPDLCTVNIRGGHPSASLLKSLASCPRLYRLQLDHCTLSEESLNAIGKLTQLRRLYLRQAGLPSDRWEFLAKLNQLEYLDVSRHWPDPFPFRYLPPSVKKLDAEDTRIDFSDLPPGRTWNLELILARNEVRKEQLVALLRVCPRMKAMGFNRYLLSTADRQDIQREFPNVRFDLIGPIDDAPVIRDY